MSKIPGKTAGKQVFVFGKPNSEVFAVMNDGKPAASGYAAKFNTYSEDLGGFRTTIAPGAFDRVLQAGADCRFLVNHDSNLLFGRTSSGTLRLRADDTGLHFDADPPATAMWSHYAELITRGDMDGCSFTCDIDIDQWDFSGATPIRTIQSVSALYDVGPVTFPAFTDTSVSASFALEAARLAESDRIEAAARRRRHARSLFMTVSLGL